MIRNNNGITLIALVITIIILLIIASITTYTGINTIRSSKLTKFKQELEIMQAEVDLLYEDCKNEDGSIDTNKVNSIGKDLSNLETEEINDIFDSLNVDNIEDYRYYDTETIESLEISGVENEYLVSIKDRNVISIEGFESEGVLYRNLYQFPDKEKFEGNIDRGEVTFSVNVATSTEGWNVHISNIKYSKYVGKGKILYQQVGEDSWKTLVTELRDDEYDFFIQEPGEYNIKIIDAANVEKITESPIILEPLGNYLVDGTTYYDTLQEAVNGARDGSTIKVINNVSEVNGATINKEIILDTNGKIISNDNNNPIIVESIYNVTIKGTGSIIKTGNNGNGGSSIINNGNLNINDVTLISNAIGINGTIINNGNLKINNSKISSTEEWTLGTAIMNNGEVIINDGEIGTIYNYADNSEVLINNGQIVAIKTMYNTTTTINGGNITEEILVRSDYCTINIGDENETVNSVNPEINKLTYEEGMVMLGFDVNIYNGIIKNINNIIIENEINIVRTGYELSISDGTEGDFKQVTLKKM